MGVLLIAYLPVTLTEHFSLTDLLLADSSVFQKSY